MLRITDITLRNFRSYDELMLRDLGELTIFVGPNASGKTNAVEAIQLLTALVSFRNATAGELVKRGQQHARIEASLTDGNRLLDVGLQLEADPPGRHFLMNGKRRAAKDIRGTLPSVTFTPDDLNLVKGSDRHRRREVDVLGAQLNANYFQLVRDYDKVQPAGSPHRAALRRHLRLARGIHGGIRAQLGRGQDAFRGRRPA